MTKLARGTQKLQPDELFERATKYDECAGIQELQWLHDLQGCGLP
jgi:hypothetical protein